MRFLPLSFVNIDFFVLLQCPMSRNVSCGIDDTLVQYVIHGLETPLHIYSKIFIIVSFVISYSYMD